MRRLFFGALALGVLALLLVVALTAGGRAPEAGTGAGPVAKTATVDFEDTHAPGAPAGDLTEEDNRYLEAKVPAPKVARNGTDLLQALAGAEAPPPPPEPEPEPELDLLVEVQEKETGFNSQLGPGGGGQGAGRIHGLGQVDTGGGRGGVIHLDALAIEGQPVGGTIALDGKDGFADRQNSDGDGLRDDDGPPEDRPIENLEEAAPDKAGRKVERPRPGVRGTRAGYFAADQDLEGFEDKNLEDNKKREAEKGAARARSNRPALYEVLVDDAEPEEAEGELGKLSKGEVAAGAKDLQSETRAVAGKKQKPRWKGHGSERVDLARLVDQTTEVEGFDEAPPASFLPRMCYFENTYLGGNAAYEERLRRLEADLGRGPHLLALLDPQPFDAPEDAGLRLTATLDHSHLDHPGRVLLQVGLQGSRRYGWRRPPLDIALVVDAANPEVVLQAAEALLKRLGPQDRLAVIASGNAEPIAPLADRRDVRAALIRGLDGVRSGVNDATALDEALTTAGALLSGADDQARVPGTRTVVIVTETTAADRVARARAQVQAMALTGVVTSVVALGTGRDAAWWMVANAGNGNLHRVGAPAELGEAMEAELASLARVIARLLRINIRLAPNVEAIRVLGSRVLGQQEVVEVKAREVATDRNLSRALGVKADRGEDDDGIQTVIPYFYGGDSHVILVELWVKSPGPVAEISLRYKDMVNLGNATARTSTHLTARAHGEAAAQAQVAHNRVGFAFAEALDRAAERAAVGDQEAVRRLLRNAAHTPGDRQVVAAFENLLRQGARPDLLRDALALAADRRIGTSGGEP